jgi:NAD(P)-dependent dehydrogenase (short-subunit alcohol dehydrogenase family)
MVTGGADAIGLAIARHLASEGARVVFGMERIPLQHWGSPYDPDLARYRDQLTEPRA